MFRLIAALGTPLLSGLALALAPEPIVGQEADASRNGRSEPAAAWQGAVADRPLDASVDRLVPPTDRPRARPHASPGTPELRRATSPWPVWGEIFVASEPERYLRLLQLAGRAPAHPWSVRGLGPREIESLVPISTDHPWRDRYAFGSGAGPLQWAWVHPATSVIYNSAFPYGANDGPVWAGRGLTTVFHAGGAMRLGPLTAVIAPIFFRAENRGFVTTPHGGADPFGDGRFPESIDLPQRFGDGPYSQLLPGQSNVRLDLGGAAIGASSANQHWGPAVAYPLLLGANAPGFRHAFVGTSRPVSVGIGSLHGRLLAGRLEQSPHSPMPEPGARRWMSGAVATFTPRGVPGLELGGGRFFHIAAEEGFSPAYLLRPLEAFSRDRIADADERGENQLASIFGRWVFPGSGFEVYAEYGREDHSHNMRDFLLQPDHDSAYSIGFQRLVPRRGGRWWVVRGEIVNAEVSHLNELRPQAPFYLHADLRQGHTHRGQLLGSPAVYGGAGAVLALDRYGPGGRWTAFGERMLRQERMGPDQPDATARGTHDTIYAIGVENVLFLRRLELKTGLTAALNLDRDFVRDVLNLRAAVQLRARL